MTKSNLKKIVFIALLILFAPTAIYLLAVGSFILFFIVALVVYVAIKLLNKMLD